MRLRKEIVKRPIAIALQITLLSGGQAAIGWAQTLLPLTAPRVQVVAASTGATVQGAGNGSAFMDLGHVSQTSQNLGTGLALTKDKTAFNVTTDVDLLLECPAVDASRHASIAAFLQQPSLNVAVSFDRITLATVPATISSQVSCGATTQHSLQIRVPSSAPAGTMNVNVGFQVTLQ